MVWNEGVSKDRFFNPVGVAKFELRLSSTESKLAASVFA
jgi:hypothetical protein